MKILLIELKIVLCMITLALLLGIITVSPCCEQKGCSFLGRSYKIDCQRASELAKQAKGLMKKCCRK